MQFKKPNEIGSNRQCIQENFIYSISGQKPVKNRVFVSQKPQVPHDVHDKKLHQTPIHVHQRGARR
jgi:hypothetical protein